MILRNILPFFLLVCGAGLQAHVAAMPDWVKGSLSCTVDLYLEADATRAEVSLPPADALRLSKQGSLPALVQKTLLLNGAAPARVEANGGAWLATWPGKSPAAFELKVGLFDGLGESAWCRVFLMRDDLNPDKAYFITSGQSFTWPERPGLGATWLRFFKLGYTHILPEGLDHILFVLGLCLGASSLAALLAQVTAFTLAHSLTLGLAAAGVFGLHSRIVEPLIAFSIAWVALENLSRAKPSPKRWMLVAAFGLLHGLGFAGALREAGLPQGAFVPALASFNLGVEAGQLSVVGCFLLAVWGFRERGWYRGRVVLPLSFLIAGLGIFWAWQRLM